MKRDYPIIVIGAGAGGLVVAIGAAKAGKKVLLIDRGTWGGDCTNFGCIPSKSLIASAHIAHGIRSAEPYGIKPECTVFDSSGVMPRVQGIVEEVRGHEDPAALHELGVETQEGMARFVDPHTVEVDGKRITGNSIVIATGSSPATLDLGVPYCNNECIFELEQIPTSLIVIGAGPIGCELGQAFSRLGAKTTMVEEKSTLLLREEEEAQKLIIDKFRNEGIDIRLDAKIKSAREEHGITIDLEDGSSVSGDVLLVGTGRRPNVSELNLEAAGIEYSDRGIPTDAYGRTNKKHIFAIGDASRGAPFTHMAENAGRAVLATLIMPGFLKKKLDRSQAVPRCTYVDPEVASIGLLEREAIEKYGAKKVASYRVDFDNVDRAITHGRTDGFVKVITKKWSSKILGATIVAPRAGEMLPEIGLAMRESIPLRKLATLIHPYPTYGLAVRAAADQWLTRTLVGAFK